MDQRSPSFNLHNQRQFSSGAGQRHQTLTNSRLQKNSSDKKGGPFVMLPKYSQDFMMRQQHIDELRKQRLALLESDPLAHRHSGNGLQVPTADTSRLHNSRRTFGLQVNQVRYGINCYHLLPFTPTLPKWSSFFNSSFLPCIMITDPALIPPRPSHFYHRHGGLYLQIGGE